MDQPAIEYHPYGSITFHFDDGPVTLRRCRLGDLQFAKDYLEELRDATAADRQKLTDEIGALRADLNLEGELTDEDREEIRTRIVRMNEIGDLLQVQRMDIVYDWLAAVVKRMGDNGVPGKEDWPVDILNVAPQDILNHWQHRPLASGRTPGTTIPLAPDNSEQ